MNILAQNLIGLADHQAACLSLPVNKLVPFSVSLIWFRMSASIQLSVFVTNEQPATLTLTVSSKLQIWSLRWASAAFIAEASVRPYSHGPKRESIFFSLTITFIFSVTQPWSASHPAYGSSVSCDIMWKSLVIHRSQQILHILMFLSRRAHALITTNPWSKGPFPFPMIWLPLVNNLKSERVSTTK